MAKNIRDFYHNVPSQYLCMQNYEELIKWAQGFAEYCQKYEPKKETT